MSYLLDKRAKRKKFFYVGVFFLALLVLFYFRTGALGGLSFASHKIFRPFLIFGNSIGSVLGGAGAFFTSKNSLNAENEDLKSKLALAEARISNYDSVLAENLTLKEILERKNPNSSMVLAAILSKPNQSLYDTLVIDAGLPEGVSEGDRVFALGNVLIGRISDVYSDSSKVILFSNSGEKTQVSVGEGVFMEVVGRGGGNFEMILPRDFTLTAGEEAVMPGIMPYVLALVETIISDPRDSFIKALLVSPVNIQEIKFVQVETK